MSGHSKWATIKRQKAAQDMARGKAFSKLSRAITLAAKSGTDPQTNYKLRVAMEAAKMANMPGSTIDRAIHKAKETGVLEEITYEGFGPGGVGIVVQAATDNKNRTAQEIKNIFEKGGGALGGPGSVMFNFEPMGYLLVAKEADVNSQMLSIMDLGIIDLEEVEEGIEVYTKATDLFSTKAKVEQLFTVIRAELILKPKTQTPLDEKDEGKLLSLLEALESHDDVQKVYDNAI